MKRSAWAWVVAVGVWGWMGTAQARGGQGWSVLSGDTVGSGNNVVTGQAGWPGLNLALLHGVSSQFDFGGRATFNYGEEGITASVVPGLKLQAVFRLKLVDTPSLNFGLDFEPGPLFYFFGQRFCNRYGCYYSGGTEVGFALPLQLNFGVPLGSAFMTNFGLWFPVWVAFGSSGGVVLPILFGGGFEYFIDSKLALTFNLHLGPAIDTYAARAYFQMDALFGISVKL